MKITLTLIIAALGLAACSGVATDFERPELLALVPEDMRADIIAADRHVLVVRHAIKVSPDCNDMDCPLSPRGDAMVERLADLIGAPVERAFSSAACRTSLTAAAGGIDVIPHQAIDGYAVGCLEGETVSRLRSDAFAEVEAAASGWTLVGEHSNTSCLWISAHAGEAAAGRAGCDADGRLSEDAYGDIFWLHGSADGWSLTVLPGAFLVDG